MPTNKRKNHITVQVATECEDLDADLCELEQLAKTVCERFDPGNVIVSIALVEDEQFQRLNKQFHKSDTVSDCLSFDLSDNHQADSPRLFELVLNAQQAHREALRRGHSVKAELGLYLTHGLLHNLGFDDATESQAKVMHDTEDEILHQFGYGLVYNTSEIAHGHESKDTQQQTDVKTPRHRGPVHKI